MIVIGIFQGQCWAVCAVSRCLMAVGLIRAQLPLKQQLQLSPFRIIQDLVLRTLTKGQGFLNRSRAGQNLLEEDISRLIDGMPRQCEIVPGTTCVLSNACEDHSLCFGSEFVTPFALDQNMTS